MMLIKKRIKKIISAKYKKIIFTKKDIELRSNIIKYICKKIKKSDTKLKKCVACNFYSKFLNKSNFIIFYKKFNSKLKLKEKYNIRNFKKKSNNDACFNSYIIFSKFLMNNDKINQLQKLNTILKINDLLILNYLSKNHSCQIHDFIKNIKYENKLLSRYL
ncbi:hypothetical protein [Candidatus Pelagibacter sp. HIMB1623]|uniref:hypothetical protein n=1 Tax=Candidatus Pelagibacter sp. HIMB1623 TaxID=3413358 RepID=UPI003F87A5A0